MKNRTKKLLKMLVAFTCAVTMTVPSVAVSAAETEAKEVPGTDFYPVVQSMTAESEEGMKLDGAVDLVIHGDQIEAAVPEIKALLEAEGIDYKEADAVSDGKAAIVISSDADHCDVCASENAALEKEQGYVLTASDSVNKKGQVTIVGADGEGAYYGILTLKQMFEQKTEDGRIAELTISDWPDVKLRGFVEGFYGYPWTYEGRLGLMEDCGELKMNTYIYAPKDDPYHRHQWRDLYPEEEAENIRKLAEAGHKTNVTFCWSIHPGEGFNYNNDNDYNAMIAKFEQLYDLGVRQFGISYDDLGQYPYGMGLNHANTINRVNEEFVKAKGDVKPLIVVGTHYCAAWGPGISSYFRPFYSTLDEDVIVMWTGNGTMSVVSKSVYDWPKNQTGVNRDLASWWNYPVNDYCDGKLLMSPLETLYTDVDNLSGFFLNPMSQAEASKVAIYSGADYSWNVQDFDYMESWKESIERLVPDCSEAFERFADNLSYLKDGFEFDESRYLTAKIKDLNTAVSKGRGIAEAAAALKAEFELMKEDVAAMRAMENKEMLADIKVHLDAYEVLADAGRDGMTAYMAAVEGDLGLCLTSLAGMKENLAKTAEFKITSLEDRGTKENVVDVGVKRIKPMLEMAEVQVQAILMDSIAPSTEAEVISNVEGVTGNVVLSQGNYIVSDLAADLTRDDYVGIKLPKAMKLSGIKVTGTPVDAMNLQVSLNGYAWTDVQAAVSDGVIEVTETVDATYVRVVCNADAAAVEISEFAVYPVYDAEVTPKVTTDLSHYQTYYIGNAMDGNMNSKFYSSAGTTAGSYVMVDFGGEIPVYDTTIYYAANPKGIAEGVDGFKTTKFEISTDGATWTEVGTPINYTNYEVMNDSLNRCAAKFNAEGQIARYMRFSATESYDNWVQIYEIEYNKTASNLGDGVVQLVEATMDIVGAPSLYDGDFETAPVIAATKEGDTLTYAMTTTTNVEKLTILQDKDALCNAVVSVEKVDGTWEELGTLDVECASFDVYEEILTVKLTFPADVTPVIYEIIAAGPKAEKPVEPEVPELEPEAFDAEVLVKNAKANSEQLPVAWDNDGGAGWAFDGDTTHWWHSRYQDFDQKAEWEIGSAEGDGKPATGNEIWIQTGFDKVWFVDSITYLPRSNGHGIIRDYTVSVANMADPAAQPTDADFVAVQSGTLQPTIEEQTIKLDEVTAATHIRITVASSYMKGDGGAADGDGHVAARDMKIFGFDKDPAAADKSALEAKVEEYAAVDTSVYKADTVAVFEAALEAAKDILAKEDAAQEEVDAALEALKEAYFDLEEKDGTEPANQIAVSKMTVTAGDQELINSNQSVEGPVGLAIDGNVNTFWHTDWYVGPNHDNHWLQIELDSAYMIDSFRYLPRQSDGAAGNTNGTVTAYTISVSLDGENWTEVASGDDWAVDSSWKSAKFDAVKAKYVLFKVEDAESDISIALACAAEVRLTGVVVACEEHSVELVGEKDATCTEDGYTGNEICTNCGEVVKAGEVIKAAGHAWGEAVVTDATCTEDGSSVKTCASCGEEDTTVIKAAGHTWGEWEVVKEATEEESGLEKRVCEACEEEEEKEIPKVEKPVVNPFKDVVEGQYYFDPVLWAVENKVTSGLSADTFGVGQACTREQIVTFLWNYAGQPEASVEECAFTDVNPDHYYYKAMLWAVENKITSGLSADTFGVGQACTREQIVTFLWNFAKQPEAAQTECAFADVNADHYYYKAMLWAVENGVVAGYNDTTFGTGDACTREQIVTFLYRYNNL